MPCSQLPYAQSLCYAVEMSVQDTLPKIMRLGMIGLDTSHSVEFAQRLNHPQHPEYITGGRITIATPRFSADIPWSVDRVEGFTREMREKHGVRIVDSIAEV